MRCERSINEPFMARTPSVQSSSKRVLRSTRKPPRFALRPSIRRRGALRRPLTFPPREGDLCRRIHRTSIGRRLDYPSPYDYGLLVGLTTPDDVFRALADPTRRGIFEHLVRDGELTVHALTYRAGVSQPAVSKHLGVLKLSGLVRERRKGRETHCRAEPKALAPLVDWMALYGAFWRARFDDLEALLNRME